MKEIYLSTNIKYLRKLNKKTQEEIAELCAKKKTAVCNWEKGIREPSAIDLAILSEYFNVSADDMIKKDLRLQPDNSQR